MVINIYDDIKIRKQQGTLLELEYGIIHGNKTIVFIKVGLKGSIYGYKDKYPLIAKNLNENHGCTVIVSSNPNGYDDDFEDEMNFVDEYAISKKWMIILFTIWGIPMEPLWE